MTSSYLNLYLPLVFAKMNQPLARVFNRMKRGQIPKLEVTEVENISAEINTPPPASAMLGTRRSSIPTPKGKMHICLISLDERNENEKETKMQEVSKEVLVGVKRERETEK